MEPATKFEPFTVSVNPALPATTLVGLMDEIEGEGLNTVNSTEVDAPPPGSGLKTKTTPVPPLAMSLLRILALSCVELTNVVVRACPPKYTVVPETKFTPLTWSVNPALPAVTEDGETEEIMGTGLDFPVDPYEMASRYPLLYWRESVHGEPESGVNAPVDASTA